MYSQLLPFLANQTLPNASLGIWPHFKLVALHVLWYHSSMAARKRSAWLNWLEFFGKVATLPLHSLPLHPSFQFPPQDTFFSFLLQVDKFSSGWVIL